MTTRIETISNALYFTQKARVAVQVRQTHLKKNERICKTTDEILDRCENLEGWLNDLVEDYVKNHPAFPWFSEVKGIGNLNIGKVISMIDIEKAEQVSKLWRYAGFGVINGVTERQKKGEKLHYNKTLKSMCWRLGKSLIRAKGRYYDFYQKEKKRLIEREETKGKKIVSSTKLPKVNGKHVETDEFFALGHVDSMAMRKMIKLFLSHLWLKWREAEGLKISDPYVSGIMGHENIIDPDEMIEKL